MDFLRRGIELLGVHAHAESCDVVHSCPRQTADLALVLKAIPCLEQIDKSAGSRLLDTLDVSHMLVSFPSQSLGGRAKGMAATYEHHLYKLVGQRPWQVRRFAFERELAFLISK
jgi:16S rRNA (guanine(1405)-N(7))-methyltransferase